MARGLQVPVRTAAAALIEDNQKRQLRESCSENKTQLAVHNKARLIDALEAAVYLFRLELSGESPKSTIQVGCL